LLKTITNFVIIEEQPFRMNEDFKKLCGQLQL